MRFIRSVQDFLSGQIFFFSQGSDPECSLIHPYTYFTLSSLFPSWKDVVNILYHFDKRKLFYTSFSKNLLVLNNLIEFNRIFIILKNKFILYKTILYKFIKNLMRISFSHLIILFHPERTWRTLRSFSVLTLVMIGGK